MPNLHIQAQPAMTLALVDAGAFEANPMVVVDVGARGGVEWYWKVFGNGIRIFAFEPDAEECAKLQANSEPNVTYLPVALDARIGTRTLHVSRHSSSASFYPSNMDYYSRFDFADNMATLSRSEIATTTLRDALKDQNPDFIKLDAEGAELDILRGADLDTVLGIVTEVRFNRRMSGCPTYAEMDSFCRDSGFELYDLDLYRYSRRALSYPVLYDFRDENGPLFGPTTQGQTLAGDALYFRDGITTTQPIKLACLFEIFGLADCAAEIVQAHREAFAAWIDPTRLLDLLVPEVKSQRLSYVDYQSRVAGNDALFRPTSGRRFPEPIIAQYDGTFTPSWSAIKKHPSLWRSLGDLLRRLRRPL